MNSNLKMFLKLFYFLIVSGAAVNGLPMSTDVSHYFERIVGGHLAPPTPHMVAILAGDLVRMQTCGGSIVSPNLILTAAHCIDALIIEGQFLESAKAVVGTTNWNSGGLAVHFKGYHNHPHWDLPTIKNDIGFIVIDKSLNMSDKVAPVTLNFEWVGGGEPSYVTGYGRLSTWGMLPFDLQKLYVDTISPEQCIYGVYKVSSGFGPQVDPKVEICTYHSVGHGTCNGDSGSALVSTNTNMQTGIVSWGFHCAIGAPDVFVRISSFRSFILQIMEKYP